MSARRAPVVIVGAGPIGLAMALELATRDVRTILVEQGDGTIEHPRTGLIAIRTMEMFRRWGIASQVRECGFPDDYPLSMVFCTSLNGFELDRESYPSMRDAPTPDATPEKKQRCPQMWLQPILARAVAASPHVTSLYRHRFERLHNDAESCRIDVTDLGSQDTVTLTASYVLGADGAASRVREQAGIVMEGRFLSYSVNVLFRSPGLAGKHRMGPAERYLFVGPQGTWGNLTVVDGADLWRMTVLGSDVKMDLESFDAGWWLRRAFGTLDDPDRIPFEVVSVVPWRRSEMIAHDFRAESVLIAGDAAHTMSPTGGMGMNTGMQEVLDLGWKLAADLAGWAGPHLLESYQIERRPIAARNIRFSTMNFNAWRDTPDASAVCDRSEAGAATRRAIGHRLRESTRVEWESLGLQIGHRYDTSPCCIPDGSPPVPDDFREYVPTTRPGSRAPHAWLAPGKSTLDLFGPCFTLVVSRVTPLADDEQACVAGFETAFAQRDMGLRVVRFTRADVVTLYERRFVLVRPDGHVAWRSDEPQDCNFVVDAARGMFARAEIEAWADGAAH